MIVDPFNRLVYDDIVWDVEDSGGIEVGCIVGSHFIFVILDDGSKMLLNHIWNQLQGRVKVCKDHSLLHQVNWQLFQNGLAANLNQFGIDIKGSKIGYGSWSVIFSQAAIPQIPAVEFNPFDGWQFQAVDLIKGGLTQVCQPGWFRMG